jgi:hypothetical protein
MAYSKAKLKSSGDKTSPYIYLNICINFNIKLGGLPLVEETDYMEDTGKLEDSNKMVFK